MSSENVFTTENKIERDHLKAYISKLCDQELTHPMAAGWTLERLNRLF